MEKIKKMVACSTCGAEFDESQVRCPFCGTAYVPAEENEYMEGLDDIRKDLEDHKEDADKSIKSGMNNVAKTTLWVIIVLVFIALGSMWLLAGQNKSREDKRKEEFLIEQGITPKQEDNTK